MSEEAISESDLEPSLNSEEEYLENEEDEEMEDMEEDEDENDGDDEDDSVGEWQMNFFLGHNGWKQRGRLLTWPIIIHFII